MNIFSVNLFLAIVISVVIFFNVSMAYMLYRSWQKKREFGPGQKKLVEGLISDLAKFDKKLGEQLARYYINADRDQRKDKLPIQLHCIFDEMRRREQSSNPLLAQINDVANNLLS